MEERLRKFARLVDVGSFTAASQELRISQPALSMAIHKLERELRTELLVRHSRHFQLTEAGKLAYDAAHELGSISSNLSTCIAALNGERPTVILGMIDSVAGIIFSSATNVDDIERQANLSVVVNNSRALRRGIERNEIDVAFITESSVPTAETSVATYVATEPLVLVCHSSQLAMMQHEVQNHRLPRFISYDHASASRHIIDTALQGLDIRAEPRFFSTSPDVMIKLTLLQKGSAVLPYWLVRDAIIRQELALLGTPHPIVIQRRILGLRAPNRQPIIPYEELIQQIRGLIERYGAATHALLKG